TRGSDRDLTVTLALVPDPLLLAASAIDLLGHHERAVGGALQPKGVLVDGLRAHRELDAPAALEPERHRLRLEPQPVQLDHPAARLGRGRLSTRRFFRRPPRPWASSSAYRSRSRSRPTAPCSFVVPRRGIGARTSTSWTQRRGKRGCFWRRMRSSRVARSVSP